MKFSNWFEIRKKAVQKKSKIKIIKQVAFGTAAGSLSGLLGGLLFSPKSGKETREDILSTSKEIKNNIKERTTELNEDINTKVTDAKVKIYEYLDGKNQQR